MSGNFAIKGGGGVGPLMANAILNFHFDFLHTSLRLTELAVLVTEVTLLVTIDITGPIDLRKDHYCNHRPHRPGKRFSWKLSV